MSTPRKVYKTNYIAEAVCEIRCDVSASDDIALYEFYSAIKTRFPIREKLQNVHIHYGKPGSAPPPAPATAKMRFSSEDRLALVQAGFGVLSISYVQYPDWVPFSKEIEWVTQEYLNKMSPVKAISRVGLRYINKFRLARSQASLSDYFNIVMQFPGLFKKITSFDLTTVNELHERFVNVKFASGNQTKDDKNPILILDIDCHSGTGLDIRPSQLSEYLDDTHTCLKEVFESLITETTRKDILRGYVSK